MTFAWGEYVELADALLANRATFADEEACCRASISRASYAIFCAARNYAAINEGLQLSGTGDDHQRVHRHFEQRPRRNQRNLGQRLSLLRRNRNRADYDDEMPQVVWNTQLALASARQAMTIIDALRP